MGLERLGKLQRQILVWLRTEQIRTGRSAYAAYTDLVRAMPADKSNVTKSVRNLERKGLVVLGYSPGGYAVRVSLTGRGWKQATALKERSVG